MAVVTPTTPGVASVIAVESIATGNSGTRQTLDVRTKFGAWLYAKIGRTVATALTAAPAIKIRRTYNNDAGIHIDPRYDFVANIAAAVLGTLTATMTIGQASCTITGGASFLAGDNCTLFSGATRVETLQLSFKNSATVASLTEPCKIAHATGDLITTMADVSTIWVPPGHYSCRSDNGVGGVTCLFELLAETYDSDTIT